MTKQHSREWHIFKAGWCRGRCFKAPNDKWRIFWLKASCAHLLIALNCPHE